MIAIFTVLGLLLFGGGAYAIYDGWPYLVLERGFTQVIIGSIASSAGLIMLSLAWVLKEVRATRHAIIEALGLRTEASIPTAIAVEPQPVLPSRPEFPSFSDKAAPAAIGAVAGAVATGAAAHALASSDDETSPAPAEAPSASADRDLFGALVTRNLEEPAAESELEAAPDSQPAAAEEAEPLPDMFEEALPTAPLQPPPPPFAFKEENPPAQVADEFASWLEEADIDGFNICRAFTPGTFVDIADLLVPELQDRGLFKTRYGEGTLRQKLMGHGDGRMPASHPAARYRHPPREAAQGM